MTAYLNSARRLLSLVCLPLALFCFLTNITTAVEVKPGNSLKALFLTGGGYHDYEKLAPFLTTNLSQLINVKFDVEFDMKRLKDEHFADGYDVIVYDVCFDEADKVSLEN